MIYNIKLLFLNTGWEYRNGNNDQIWPNKASFKRPRFANRYQYFLYKKKKKKKKDWL